jgi:hypothetical protein
MVRTNIVARSDRPDMAPAVADWLLVEFRHSRNSTHEVLTANLLAQRPARGGERDVHCVYRLM